MLYEELRKRKKDLNLTTEQLSQLSGIPTGTINKILTGETRSPRYDTLRALESVLFETASMDTVHETKPIYAEKMQGEYTLEDYYGLPNDVRAELIDGVIFHMASPTFSHQETITALLFEFESYIRSNKGSCKVLAAPLDVQLNCDDKTIVQPDIVVTCQKEYRSEKGIFGAPDLCIEVVSDSSRRRDYGLKVTKYMDAGVREYWIIDVRRECVVCYYFEGEEYPFMYTFQDKVPVRIYSGDMKVDFSVIRSRLFE